MPRKAAGPHERALGAELRALRQATGPKLTVTAAASRLGWSKSMLSNLENGKRKTSAHEVAALLDLYGITGDRRDRLVERAEGGRGPGLWERNLPGVPPETNTLAGYENEAVRLLCWEPLLVPDLLRTVDYTRAFLTAGGVDPRDVEPRLMALLRRQQVLRGDVEYVALVGEAALHTAVGGRRVMAEQWRDVLRTAGLPNVRIGIVPSTAVHPGMTGPFLLVEFPVAEPIAHVGLQRSAVFLERGDVAPYVTTAARVAAVALGATESLRLVTARADELEGGT
ncbi:transcriptional regulator with XRE-family HTH domain [Saccharothrix tamanrassetensis]|uniref:Transcriptional regulator with XRE-family HTH domain n=1 Tax=Saccharothrix tamanrassetensis TaxID=1051531 RepID=A0A841CHJ6_9PSEU|nr:helix-turn-helix transcriptional regulator [Saccharothrix tamanrassetensis]MBB5956460.1 transcriptional regulator with XRE-family HTH domain [Saccharothrix tamanrassetensis]